MSSKIETRRSNGKGLMTGIMFAGIAAGVWSIAALMSGLSHAGWQVSELLRNYMVALGMIQEHETFLAFYTHIKGIEYIIAVAFLGAFPAFFKLVNTTKTPVGIKNV